MTICNNDRYWSNFYIAFPIKRVCFNRNKKLLRISCNSCRSFDVYCDDVKKSDISMLDEHRTKQKVVKWWIANYW